MSKSIQMKMASLVADYSSSENESVDDSSSDSSNQSTEEVACTNGRATISANKLPLPDFALSGGLSLTTSVFSNPFTEAERAKRAILEKHVKMTPTKDETKMINGKLICWSFRKGRCRFGHKCKFAHDSDLHHSSLQENGLPLCDTDDVINQIVETPIEEEDVAQDENKSKVEMRKKRPGLSQGIVPGKKVMKMYKKHAKNASLPSSR